MEVITPVCYHICHASYIVSGVVILNERRASQSLITNPRLAPVDSFLFLPVAQAVHSGMCGWVCHVVVTLIVHNPLFVQQSKARERNYGMDTP